MRNVSGHIRALRRRASFPRTPLLLPTGEQVGLTWHEPYLRLMVIHWQGYNVAENVREAAENLLSRVPAGTQLLLSDGSRAAGDWQELVPWIAYDYLPRLRDLGISGLAVVPSVKDGNSRLAHTQLEQHAGHFLPFRIFETLAEARLWLRDAALALEQTK